MRRRELLMLGSDRKVLGLPVPHSLLQHADGLVK